MPRITARLLLERSAERMDERGTWTQRVTARTRSGKLVSVIDERATKFCAVGHVVRSAWEMNPRLNNIDVWSHQSVLRAIRLLEEAARQVLGIDHKGPSWTDAIVTANDSHGPRKSREIVRRCYEIALEEA